MVNEKDFYSCKVDTAVKENRLLHRCSQPGKLSFYNINFANVHYSKHANFSSIYLLATSNGTKGSLNNTSEGHCKNEEEGISLRIKFSVCDASLPNNSCKESLTSSTNKSKGSLTCHNDTVSTCTSRTTVESIHHWEVLAICLGVVLGLSLVINIIAVLYVCVWRKRAQGPSKTKAEEPMKSLIVEPHKSKHGRVSAAL
ncbi:uncharacterized protein LOC110243708 [Exaiptasia diaphana]|uniref:Uncharacterized protein n=1 Tax=Exaiptasia diaphana TaxID=2652724 RepID=A0A913XIU9_EXADI|nr:uncharacterized protein LOC110243708 [Exaiptasia diaphana]